MSTRLPTIWAITPHTEAKHKILRAYFGAWLAIVGQKFADLAFFDGFCGPGIYRGGEPGSPLIVIDEANRAFRTARVTWKHGLSLRLWFVDQDTARIENLRQKLSETQNNDPRIVVNNPAVGTFEEHVKPILTDLESARPRTCPFLVFIDPFGVKGFSMATINRILSLEATEISTFPLLSYQG